MTRPANGARAQLGRPPAGITQVPLKTAWAAYVENGSDEPLATQTKRAKHSVGNILGEVFGEDRMVWQLTPAILNAALVSAREGHDAVQAAYWREHDKRRVRTGIKAGLGNIRSTLHQFVKFCHDMRYLSRDVVLPDAVAVARKEEPFGEELVLPSINPEQWPMVLNVAGLVSPRCRIIMALGLLMGRRISDVVYLRWEHIDWDRGVIRWRNVKMGRWVCELPLEPIRSELIRWHTFVLQHFGEVRPEWPVIPAKAMSKDIKGPGSHLKYKRNPHLWPLLLEVPTSTNSLRRDLNKVWGQFGIGTGEGFASHVLRRSRGAQLSRDNGIASAQGVLDHANPLTTRMAYEKGIDAKRAAWRALAPGDALPDVPWVTLTPPPGYEAVVDLGARRKAS